MKPCKQYQNELALLALGNLETQRARQVRAHCAVCGGCRTYLEELSHITSTLSHATPSADIQPTPDFHSRLIAQVHPREANGHWFSLMPKWRIAIPAFAAIAAVAIVSLLASRPPGRPAANVQAMVKNVSSGDVPEATLATYKLAAGISTEALDDLLARQARENTWSGPVYTASAARAAHLME